MLDFEGIRSKHASIDDLCRELDTNDLRQLTDEVLDAIR